MTIEGDTSSPQRYSHNRIKQRQRVSTYQVSVHVSSIARSLVLYAQTIYTHKCQCVNMFSTAM